MLTFLPESKESIQLFLGRALHQRESDNYKLSNLDYVLSVNINR